MIEELTNNEILIELDNFTDAIIEHDMVKESKDLITLITRFLGKNKIELKNNPEILIRYEHYLTKAKLVVLFDLEEEEILKMISNHLVDILNFENYNLYEKLRQKLLTIYKLEERDEFKKKIKEQLLAHSGKITNEKIKINDLTQNPTIGNWLKDYYSKTGLALVDSLKQNQYLVNDINTKHLSVQEKGRLKRLIYFFEKLKLSSSDSDGTEEHVTAILPDGRVAIVSDGNIEKAPSNILRLYDEVTSVYTHGGSSVSISASGRYNVVNDESNIPKEQENETVVELETTLTNYSPSSLEYKTIKQEIERINKTK